MPTALERRGDYSQSPVVIYDPLTTRPDPAVRVSSSATRFRETSSRPTRLNPVALNLVKLLPLPTAGRSAARTALPIADLTNQATVKLDHHLSDAANAQRTVRLVPLQRAGQSVL